MRFKTNKNFNQFVEYVLGIACKLEPSRLFKNPYHIFKESDPDSFWGKVHLDLMNLSIIPECNGFYSIAVKFLEDHYFKRDFLIENGLIESEINKNAMLEIVNEIRFAQKQPYCLVENYSDCERVKATRPLNGSDLSLHETDLAKSFCNMVCTKCIFNTKNNKNSR